MNFKSYDELCESIKRGNEIQFKFGEKLYFICPHWNNSVIDGCIIGECYSDSFDIIDIKNLYCYVIQDTTFYKAFSTIEIVDRVI